LRPAATAAISGSYRMQGEPHRFSRDAEDLIASLRRVPSEDPPRQKIRGSKPVAELMEAIRSKHGLGRPTAEQAIRDEWPAVVGPANAAYSHAVRIDERRRLIVQASHAVVRNELFLNRAEILERIRRLPGCEAVRNLHLVQA
jgi:hypothetical protein